MANERDIGFCKSMEQLVRDAGLLYLTENSLINVPKRFPIIILLSAQQDMSALLDKKQGFDMVLLDLSKAFDVLNHGLPFSKMVDF